MGDNSVSNKSGIDSNVNLPPGSGQTNLEPAPIFDVKKSPNNDRLVHLNELLAKGHITVAPLREPELILHSHLPHLLGSAYGLGADVSQLTECYEHIITTLKEIDETFIRGEKINDQNWRSNLQQKSFTVAYVDFFDKEIAASNGDWTSIAQKYLYSGAEPLINGFMGGLAHPFIHLAYAYEFRNDAVLSEALSLGCTEYIQCHGLLDTPPPDTSTYKTSSLTEIIQRVQHDPRFDNIVENPGTVNFGFILASTIARNAFIEHWNAWAIDSNNLAASFENICDTAVMLAISTTYPGGKFDFFYAHTLTLGHAIRVLWDEIPADRRESILRQYALFTIGIYILQLRRPFSAEQIEDLDDQGRDWDWIRHRALTHRWALDDHFFKVARALQEMDRSFGDKNGFYCKSVVEYLSKFDGWEGFGQGIMGYLPSRDGYIPA